ncbi:MFS transporter [Alicyclobacillus fastidiosus]|uniref:MFS transporter n=1 Tax=Alicyclobacillus fastidiosus TaxID=392011 RepID=A0ABV5AGG6_9BACL|nr:MFS transporter [Alicyclobacillus fastidiosus]WEH09000.1 MFS transporter [Alicyclobacillus fastidiosus]
MKTLTAASVPKSRWVRIIPAVVLIYVVAAFDKTNISYAMAGGMSKSLSLTTTFSGLASGIFFIGYLFLQVPGGIIAERRNAKAYVAWTVVIFGLVAMLSGLAQNWWELLASRFLLGVAEGGLFPAILIILTRWFPREERGRANGFFLMNGPIAGFLGGPLGGWIMTFSNWRALFIIEGCLSFLLLAIFLPFISNRPEDDKHISEAERNYIVAKLAEEKKLVPQANMNLQVMQRVLRQPNSWKLIVVYFCMAVGIYGFSMWLPTTIENLTHTGIGMVGLLSALPNIVSMIGCFALALWADRRGNSRFWTAFGLFGFAVCLVLSTWFKGDVWLSFVFILGCGFFLHSPSGVFWTIPPMLSDADTAAAERGLINGLGNLGGFVGPFFVGWLTTVANSSVSFYSLVIFTLIGVVVTMTLPRMGSGKSSRTATTDVSHAK